MEDDPTLYPWYVSIGASAPLQQGDLIENCPVILPVTHDIEAMDIAAERHFFNVIVATQSCDLLEGKTDVVLACPYFTLSEIQERDSVLRSRNGRQALRDGAIKKWHLLNESTITGLERPLMVVSFRNVYSLPIDLARGVAERRGTRLRLCPPYLEEFSQAFARVFMRVALPITVTDI